MLKLTADVESERAIRDPSRYSGNVVESLFLRAAEVVIDGLCEVIAVSERFSRNFRRTRVGRFHPEFSVVSATEPVEFSAEFLRQILIQPSRFATAFIVRDAISCFADLARTFQSRPGAHPHNLAADVAHRGQAFELGIDPAIERDIRRSHEL